MSDSGLFFQVMGITLMAIGVAVILAAFIGYGVYTFMSTYDGQE